LVCGGVPKVNTDWDTVIIFDDLLVEGSRGIISDGKNRLQVKNVSTPDKSLGVKPPVQSVELALLEDKVDKSSLRKLIVGIVNHATILADASEFLSVGTVDARRHISTVNKLASLAVVGFTVVVNIAGVGEARTLIAGIRYTITVGINPVIASGGADIAVVGYSVIVSIETVGGEINGQVLA